MVPGSRRPRTRRASLASFAGRARACALPFARPFAAGAAPLAAYPSAPAAALDVAAAEAQFLDLLNADRTGNGLALLQADQRLMDLARWRSEDMVARNFFSHDIGGLTIFQLL